MVKRLHKILSRQSTKATIRLVPLTEDLVDLEEICRNQLVKLKVVVHNGINNSKLADIIIYQLIRQSIHIAAE